jgi:hypothetical protein
MKFYHSKFYCNEISLAYTTVNFTLIRCTMVYRGKLYCSIGSVEKFTWRIIREVYYSLHSIYHVKLNIYIKVKSLWYTTVKFTALKHPG